MNNIHLVLNTFNPDIRVYKEGQAIDSANLFKKIIIIALHETGYEKHEILSGNVEIFRISLRTKKLPKRILFQTIKYLEWQFKVLKLTKNMKVAVIHCHDLSTLPTGNKIKRKKDACLIYDAHELETERNQLKGIKKITRKITEKINIKKVDRFISVSPNIIEWYKKNYHLSDTTLVRNIPDLDMNSSDAIELKHYYDLKNEILFAYCGMFFKNRGIELILDLFSKSGPNKHIVFLGKGALEPTIKEYEKKYSNIHLYGFLPYERLISSLKTCDAGILIKDDNQSLSQYYALPNKFFQYLNAEIPVLVSNSLDVEEVISKYNIGWVAGKNNIKEKLESIEMNDINNKKSNFIDLQTVLNWKNEKEKLITLYNSIIKGK